jgi:molybdopterin-guanine dinucleotide biosynthesis protein A
MVKRAALILAGGKARRFQTIDKVWQDKALAQLQRKPLLIHAVEAVLGVVDELAVCVNDAQRMEKYTQVLQSNGLANVNLVVDEQVSGISGPNVAIMSGLRAVKADYCFTLPCDMPFLQPKVAEYLFAEGEECDVLVPMWPNGRLETLMMVLERKTSLKIAQTLCVLKRPRSDDLPRGAGKIKLISPINHIKKLDPELKSFININSKEDLYKLQTRQSHGSITENLKLNLGGLSIPDLQMLQEGARLQQENKLAEAQITFIACASNFEASKMNFWAGVGGESQGEALLKLSGQQTEQKEATQLDFEGKEAYHRAANNYCIEAQLYEENRCRLLEERALADKMWCESWAMGKTGHIHRYPSKVR